MYLCNKICDMRETLTTSCHTTESGNIFDKVFGNTITIASIVHTHRMELNGMLE
jgi:hypothetical protein